MNSIRPPARRRALAIARTLSSIPVVLVIALSLILGFPIPAEAASPGWIVSCSLSHQSHDDPILYPGRPGAAHFHEFVGARSTDAFSTQSSLRAGGTTCAMPGDTSAYWTPAMYENGQLVPLSYGNDRDALFYYRRKGIQDGEKVSTIPDGLRVILGNMHAKSPAENPGIASGNIIFKCGPGSTEDLPHPPTNCGSDDNIVVSLRFPNCWDGRNLDSPDHFSHMAYPDGNRCPASHPVNIPRMESFFRYQVGSGPIGEISFSSGPWWTIHQDFFNAWDQGSLQGLLNECINANRDCGKNPRVAPATPTTTSPPSPNTTMAPTTTTVPATSTTHHQPPPTTVTTTAPTTTMAPGTTVPATANPTLNEIVARMIEAAQRGDGFHLNRHEVQVLVSFFTGG